MLTWLQRYVDIAYFAWHVFPVVWRYVNGRYHVWREAPLWVIKEYVQVGEDNPEFEDLYRQALDELRLRERKKS